MSETYAEIRDRVERYFELNLHVYEAAKHFETCKHCFSVEDHPLHLKE